MKRHLATLLLFVIVVSYAGAAHAQSDRAYSFLASAGIGFAATPELFTNYYDMGYCLTLGLDFPVSPKWSVIGFVDLKKFSPAEDMILDWYTDEGGYPDGTNHKVSEGALGSITLGLTGKGRLKSETSTTYPFLRGGFGITIAGANEVKVDYLDDSGVPAVRWHAGIADDTNLSTLVALGLEFSKSESLRAMFLEVGLHSILQEGKSPAIVFVVFGLTL